MPRPDRVLFVSLWVALLVGGPACGSPTSRAGSGCSSDEQCRPDARCSSNGCVVNTPPIANFAISGELQETALVTLDGSASRDPDRADAITSYVWSIEAEEASCEAPAVASHDAVVQVRFGCAGQYHARLVVLDGKYAESAPATRPLQIQPRSAPALVQAGPDQSVGHVCAGAPLTCRLASAVQLTAATTAPGPVAFHWSVQPPPGRELDAHRRVRFIPDEGARDPTVEIETDGTAIAGDWQFRVELKDGIGVLDADVVRVSVGNRAPVIAGGPPGAFDHLFDASSHVFTASGSFPVEVMDEDGDPVEREVAFHHAGDGGATFVGADAGTAVTFWVAVPFTAPQDALLLRGGAGLERSIAFTATDVNGGAASTSFDVTIANREPTQVRAGELAAVHAYEPATNRFVSRPGVGTWRDPDGDPITYAVTGDADCPTSAIDPDGTVRMQCSREFTGVGALPTFLQPRQAQVQVRDPWGAASTLSAFGIGNRAPTAASSTFRPALECRLHAAMGHWCPTGPMQQEVANLFPASTLNLPLGVTDPDGDPVAIAPAAPAFATTCYPGQPCTLLDPRPDWVSCEDAPPDVRIPFAVTDGVASSLGSVLVDPVCR